LFERCGGVVFQHFAINFVKQHWADLVAPDKNLRV